MGEAQSTLSHMARQHRQAVPTEQRSARWLRNALLAVAGLMGAAMLVHLACVRNYDYDEISHAHMAWLLSTGEKPYQDFAANHFPFFWIAISPLMRLLPQEPVALMLLRGLAVLLNAVFIGALGSLICLELRPAQRIWAAACFGLIVFSPTAVQFLIEFRPDALANALLFAAMLWVRLRGTKRLADGLLAGLMMGAGRAGEHQIYPAAVRAGRGHFGLETPPVAGVRRLRRGDGGRIHRCSAGRPAPVGGDANFHCRRLAHGGDLQ